MHSHHIALALADARAADLQRAATHTTATAPPRRHSRTLAVLGVAATAAISALAPTGASARPIESPGAAANAHHAGQAANTRHDLRSPDARDAAEGRGTFNSPQVVVVKAQRQTSPTVTNGIDWGDAGIGAGSLLAMSVLALGGTLFITHRRRDAHAAS